MRSLGILLRPPCTATAVVALSLVAALAGGCASRGPAPTGSHDRTPVRAPRSAPVPTPRFASAAIDLAADLLGSPYRYGGDRPSGFDCSGLTAFIFAHLGYPIPRTAQQQAGVGDWVPLDELRAGDLVFFGNDRDRQFHVGLVVSHPGDPLTMIHAATSRGVSRTVVTDSDYWLRRLTFGRRVLSTGATR